MSLNESMLCLKIFAVVVAALLGGHYHETLQNERGEIEKAVLSDRGVDAPEKFHESDEGRNPPVTRALLQTPTGVAGGNAQP